MSESVPLSLASRLNSRRREIGMSGGELARKTGLSRSHVNALLSGKRSPTPSISEDLTRVLELDDVLAQELRSLDESVYKSGFASGPIRLTKAEKANE